jgi:hypothetical protein
VKKTLAAFFLLLVAFPLATQTPQKATATTEANSKKAND